MTVAVIGGGPAGMSAAISAAEAGAEVVLFEKNEKLGKKLYITGKGRCNVTNSAEGEEFLSKVNTNPKFLYAALSGFSSSDTVGLMESSGVRLRLERGGRYFPVSDKASDVTKALANNMNKAGVKVLLSSEVSAVNICGGRVVSVFSDGKVYPVGALVVATGGVSYPTTGSTGSGAAFAKRAGLSVVPFKPSLCGMITEKVFPLMGLTLKNVNVTLFSGGKEKASEFGELLFTHTGVSGPTILSLSSVACKTAAARSKKQSEKSVGEKASTTAEGEISFGAEDIGEGIFPLENCRISVDLKPALSAEELDARILRDFSQQKNKILRNALGASSVGNGSGYNRIRGARFRSRSQFRNARGKSEARPRSEGFRNERQGFGADRKRDSFLGRGVRRGDKRFDYGCEEDSESLFRGRND